ncbi:MAG: cell wall hydrolase [Oscillospiraceae bacterium]|nr:cell wall hydrolase [Oscillospiraceae bacterium]
MSIRLKKHIARLCLCCLFVVLLAGMGGFAFGNEEELSVGGGSEAAQSETQTMSAKEPVRERADEPDGAPRYVYVEYMEEAAGEEEAGGIPVYVDGILLDGSVTLSETVYVSARSFCSAIVRDAQMAWEARESRLTVYVPSGVELVQLSMRLGDAYLSFNDRCFYVPGGIQAGEAGDLLVPVDCLAAAFGLRAEWTLSEAEAEAESVEAEADETETAEAETETAEAETEPAPEASVCVSSAEACVPVSAESVYNAEDLHWLTQIIHAESGNQPIEGMIGVGNVVLNRVADPTCPDTVYDVIFDCRYGVQFSPTETGSIYDEPNEMSIVAAKLCLEGYNTVGNSLFFVNPMIGISDWFSQTRTYITTIGEHAFFA